MSNSDGVSLGQLIQAYARALWNGSSKASEDARSDPRLDSGIRARIDALGLDCQRLLSVDAADVLNELKKLEREAALEDADAKPRAATIRTREEAHIHDEEEGSRGDHRVHQGGHRKPARHGRNRQRRER